jgi:hypothetical protein
MHTVRSFSGNGPYFQPTRDVYQAASLSDAIRHIRQCMDDGEYQIGLFDDNGQCKGFWLDDSEPEPDGEGGWTCPAAAYTLYRPGYTLYRPGQKSDGWWQLVVSKFGRA